ncbi:hypothetical protein V6Z12_A08G098800 [Gossypium hirsutum]
MTLRIIRSTKMVKIATWLYRFTIGEVLAVKVTDQNLDVWANSLTSVPDALCHYYY